MANVYMTDMKLLNQDNNESVSSALSAFERDMFGGSSQDKKQDHAANEADPNSLSYLFRIFSE